MIGGASTVLFTPELLEIILLNSEPLELLRLQRVCCCFRDHIASSKSIRRRLYLEAESSAVVVNNAGSSDDGELAKQKASKISSDVQPNPLILRLFRSPTDRAGHSISGEMIFEKWSLEQQMTRWDEQKFFLVHLRRDLKSNSKLSSPSASWRLMTLTQPPITHVAVFMGSPRYPGEEHPRSPDYKIVSNPQGVRLGEIVDHAQSRASSPFLEDAPLAIAILQLASYERIYSACYHAFLRYKGPGT